MTQLSIDDLPEYCRKPTLILGCGNSLFGDDGFGCAVVETLKEHVPDNVCLFDAGTSARNILFTLSLSETRPRRILIIDAIEAGHEPGDLFELDPHRIPAIKLQEFSLHQAPSSNLLRDLQVARGVEVRILACQTPPLTGEMSEALSPPIAAAVGHAAEWVLAEYLPRFTTDQIAITMTVRDRSAEIEPGVEAIGPPRRP